jgi:hypothetical protein
MNTALATLTNKLASQFDMGDAVLLEILNLHAQVGRDFIGKDDARRIGCEAAELEFEVHQLEAALGEEGG